MSPKKIATCIISHRALCCLTCPLSRVSLFCVSCPGSQTVTRRSPFFSAMALRSAQNVRVKNSNKRGCGSPAQAQASARVDVPVFPAWTMESNMSASFCVNAWICAPQATDRDPQKFNVNAWKCARLATDRDLQTIM